jgi:signal peptidase I
LLKRIGHWLVRLLREWGPVILAVLLIRSFLVESFVVPTGSMLDTIEIGDFMLVNKFVYGVKLPFTSRTVIPFSSPKPGDIIVFRFPEIPDVPEPAARYARIFPSWLQVLPVFWDREKHFFKWHIPPNYVKRCVAVAGDTVQVIDKQLYVNGRPPVEPWVVHRDYRHLPGLKAPADSVQGWWQQDRFYQTDLSPYVRDNFGPVVVPPGHVFAMGDNRDNSEDGRFWGPLPLEYVKGRPLVLYFSSRAVDNPPNFLKVVLSPWAIRLGRIGHIVR